MLDNHNDTRFTDCADAPVTAQSGAAALESAAIL
jgi:hypothetical protein